jgi:CRISPR-associated protein Cas6
MTEASSMTGGLCAPCLSGGQAGSLTAHASLLSVPLDTIAHAMPRVSDPIVDVRFPIVSRDPIPEDHGYPLYGMICNEVTDIHDDDTYSIHPVRGMVARKWIMPDDGSFITIRCPLSKVPILDALTGRVMRLLGQSCIILGSPRVSALTYCPVLSSPMVVFRNGGGCRQGPAFGVSLQRAMQGLGISTEAAAVVGDKVSIEIKGGRAYGYQVRVVSLSAEESLKLQAHGLGSRGKMGCGVFTPCL